MLIFLSTVLAAFPIPAAISAPTPSALVAQEKGFEERLERLVERLDRDRIDNHIPGYALAVVKNDKVVLLHGSGFADIENKRPVDAETIFAIGSTTKAFTASVIGMLQDDGKLTIDDPVTDYLPKFDLPIEIDDSDYDSEVTLRDLLSHRTGFTRMSILWASGKISRPRILEIAINAEPWAPFREKFLYNNVMFLAAGTAAGVAAESSWDDLIRDRIFAPLSMTSSTLTSAEAQKDERLALGYDWNEDSESFDRNPMLELAFIGPAGSINSNVTDMAQWLRLQLGHGQINGERLISDEALEDTWSANIEIASGVSYGLGWMIHDRNGQRVIEHGGNINGFAAQVSLMPDAGLGYVLLTNVTSSVPFQQGSIPTVFDILLGDEEDEQETPAGDFDEYLGSYTANFASFKDAKFEVQVKNGHLSVDVPGQTLYELHSPDEEGKWYFRLTNTIAVSFDRSESGEVIGMKMYQAGMTFDIPLDGVVAAIEIPLEQFDKFLGAYDIVGHEMRITAVIQNNRLAMDIPGQMVFELHKPDSEGRRYFRVSDKLAVRFNVDDSGEVPSLTMFEDGDENECIRVSSVSTDGADALPSVDELQALRGLTGRAKLLKEHGTFREVGTVFFAQAGVGGTYTYEASASPLAYHITIDLGELGTIERGSDGEASWNQNGIQAYKEDNGQTLQQALFAHPLRMGSDWRETFESVKIKGTEEHEGREYFVVTLEDERQPSRTMFVDAENGQLSRMEYNFVAGPVRLPIVIRFLDYAEVEGTQIYQASSEKNDMTGLWRQKLTELEVGIDLPKDFSSYKGEKE
ncbi:MAG: CubicO group peptidase (beta-lactamase class C family) [Planctomycetota bacterium]|jgi:CubicO group peptidase (beta-lactamase class C family)